MSPIDARGEASPRPKKIPSSTEALSADFAWLQRETGVESQFEIIVAQSESDELRQAYGVFETRGQVADVRFVWVPAFGFEDGGDGGRKASGEEQAGSIGGSIDAVDP